MADLPRARVTPSRPFTHSGIDFTAHFELKLNRGRGTKTVKGYVAVFVCLSTKAVHLELVSDLSTPAFLAAFRRFSARRGTPNHIYSDNGRNFVGANRMLKKEYQEILQTINTDFLNNISHINVKWHFNAPVWPTAGGLWEAAVKSLKYHLKRVIGDQLLTYEEFTTLLYQIEACLNSRPLCELTESPEDSFLTPGHFLVGGSLLSRPQTEPESTTLSKRWQLVQSMNKHFWKKWSSEYLQQLQVRSKWSRPTKNLEVNDVVLIKEDNLPPGKWAMGRIQELHPGKDGYVRVVTLKCRDKFIQRPVTKLTLLPVQDDTSRQGSQITNSNLSSRDDKSPQFQKPRHKTRTFNQLFVSFLLLLFTFVSPIMCIQQQSYNITKFNENQAFYFDKLSDLQLIKDEWKLIVFYNMSTYWQSIRDVKDYVAQLQDLGEHGGGSIHQSIILQLKHEINEIEHYNTLFNSRNKNRKKRGLINGVGYLANQLFGVLDQNFAEQYKKDIEMLSKNEYHLKQLIKNQTTIMESEYNIFRRNENIMNNQLRFIKQFIENNTLTANRAIQDNSNALYLTSSSLAADIILSNIRRIQQTLLDTVTDITHGKMNIHLLSPQQLKGQINIISTAIRKLRVPIEESNIKDIYKILTVSARIHDSYLIIEIKIPLTTNDIYELDATINIPQKHKSKQYYIVPVTPYIAYDPQKDTAIFISEKDLLSCSHTLNQKLLCSLNKPIYYLKIRQSFCDIKLVDHLSSCKTSINNCSEQWVNLRNPNSWLYSCCEECNLRIFCTHGVTMTSLNGNGIITLSEGCSIKSNMYTIYAHKNFIHQVNLQPDIPMVKLSMLNDFINASIPENFTYLENHEEMWNRVKDQIDTLKEQSSNDLNNHDVHHYSLSYIMLFAFIIMCCVVTHLLVRSRKNQPEATSIELQSTTQNVSDQQTDVAGNTLQQSSAVGVSCESVVSICEPVNISKSNVLSVDKGTSPTGPYV